MDINRFRSHTEKDKISCNCTNLSTANIADTEAIVSSLQVALQGVFIKFDGAMWTFMQYCVVHTFLVSFQGAHTSIHLKKKHGS